MLIESKQIPTNLSRTEVIVSAVVTYLPSIFPSPLPAEYTRRSIGLLAGLSIIGAGDALVVSAHLGGSPFGAVIINLSQRLGISIGSTVIGIGLVLVAIASVVSGRRPGKVAIAAPFVCGTIENLVIPFARSSRLNHWVLGGAGVTVMAIGIGVYLGAGLGRAAVETILTTISDRTDLSVRTTMIMWNVGCLALALAIGGPLGPVTFCFPLVVPVIASQVMQRSPFLPAT